MIRVSDSFAQPKSGRISLRGTAGVGYLPLKAWGDFVDDGTSDYRKERFGSYWDVGVVYRITERHSVALIVGGIEISASDLRTNSSYSVDTEWDFRTNPISLSYEFRPTKLNRQFSPFIGMGASYLLSEIEYQFEWFGEPYRYDTGGGKRNGEGYGIHAYIGLQSQITPHVYFISRLRGRYADGLGFTQKKGDIKVEFTGIDITLGIDWIL